MGKTALLARVVETLMSLTLLHKLTLCELQRKFTAGDVTATEIVRAYFLRVEAGRAEGQGLSDAVQGAAIAAGGGAGSILEGLAEDDSR